jgi:hypothetical protein
LITSCRTSGDPSILALHRGATKTLAESEEPEGLDRVVWVASAERSTSSLRRANMIIEVERTDNIPMMLNFNHVISVEPTPDPHVPVRICCSDGKSYEIKNSYDQLKEKCRRAAGPHA